MDREKSSDILNLIDGINKLCDDVSQSIENNDIDFNMIILLIDHLYKYGNSISCTSNDEEGIDEFNEKISSLLEAFEQKDYYLFSDIMQYELKPLLEYWRENIV